jgi:lysophospholipid acyltransferase (LPLAT)-like uncharacterized protein
LKEYSRKDRILFWMIEHVASKLLLLLYKTLRIEIQGEEHYHTAVKSGNFSFASWHGRMCLPLVHHRNQGIRTLISNSKDGEIAARALMGLGYNPVRGSSNEGAREALRSLIKTLKVDTAAVTIDGPKGPRHEPKIGVIAASKISGTPILPAGTSAEKTWQFNSWDRFQIPKPFSKSAIVYGEPFYIPKKVKGEELEEYRIKLKNTIIALDEEADRIVGWEDK